MLLQEIMQGHPILILVHDSPMSPLLFTWNLNSGLWNKGFSRLSDGSVGYNIDLISAIIIDISNVILNYMGCIGDENSNVYF